MKIIDFIEEFKKSTSKEALLREHIKSYYMSWMMKVAEAENIIQKSCYVDDNFRLNSPLRYYLYMIVIVRNYTDLEFDDEEAVRDFNSLEEAGISDMLVSLIGEDVEKFNTVLKMTLDDHMENYRSFAGYIDNKSSALMEVLEGLDLGDTDAQSQ